MIVLERHRQGPRIFVLGRRIHECALGLLVLVILFGGWLAAIVHPSLPVAAAGVAGSWLLVKDWRDLFASKRDSASWSFGIHRLAVSGTVVDVHALTTAQFVSVAAAQPTTTRPWS